MDKYLIIKKEFEHNSNAENASHMEKYMRNKFIYYGIKTPNRRKICRDLFKSEKKIGTIDWNFLDKCYLDDHREFQYVVLDYLIAMKKYLTYDDIPKILKYIKQKQWWDTIDGFDRIVGDIGITDSRVDDLMLEWSKDEDFWIRRISIDHQLNRKSNTNTALLEKIIVNNFGSDEFFINKAIGWSLRDYSKVDPDWVRCFLNKYKSKMNKLSIREASKYI
ncbi:MAG: DNA alkylation repair protein [Clostridiales bacterium]|nr:MAG: DNA alkylation repair protein [Clostridiales bacterium]